MCIRDSCNTIRWAECSASGRTLGGRDTRQHLSWRFYSSVFSFRCFCREQVRFAGDKARFVFRYGKRCGNRCGSSGPDRVLGFLRFFLSKSRCLQFLSSFRVLLVSKVEPEKSLLQFFASCIFSHSCPQTCTIIRLLGQGLSCILSCISPKKLPFLPQNGRFCFFSYLHCFLPVYPCFLHKHRPKSADKTACISLGYHHIAFSKINSKSSLHLSLIHI